MTFLRRLSSATPCTSARRAIDQRCTALFFLLSWFFLADHNAWSFAPDEDLTARAAVLMDATTGKILYQKDGDVQLPPASTTKVMTAIIALESGRKFSETLTVSKEATRVPAMKLYLRPGQTITVEDALYAALLSSANDASNVLAEGIAGSVERFGQLMTKKARALGAPNTNFTNPHGLTAPDHYSSARDLALMFRYAMRNPAFREIVQTKISSVNSSTVIRKKVVPRRISLRNHNRLLWNFEGAIGGKTGYTAAALKCFVGAVQRNGTTLIVSILGATDQWGDTKQLLEYGFEHYPALRAGTPVTPRTSGSERVTTALENFSALTLTPREAVAAAPQSRDGYILQVGTFREGGRADMLTKYFLANGFNAFVERTVLEKAQIAYRVRVGPYADMAHAQEVARELQLRSGYQPIIQTYQPQNETRGDAG
ncbi:MAG: D-alanyl-D-alanine carboxypeptidase [Deltaproteobacteria bacterium]|nr:D-alanyl-D-alanine carboxypeptidase [Deltaproteobacteria bacterium]